MSEVLLKKNGEILNDSDLFIAATALSRNLTLVTNNFRHFQRIQELPVENWILKSGSRFEGGLHLGQYSPY